MNVIMNHSIATEKLLLSVLYSRDYSKWENVALKIDYDMLLDDSLEWGIKTNPRCGRFTIVVPTICNRSDPVIYLSGCSTWNDRENRVSHVDRILKSQLDEGMQIHICTFSKIHPVVGWSNYCSDHKVSVWYRFLSWVIHLLLNAGTSIIDTSYTYIVFVPRNSRAPNSLESAEKFCHRLNTCRYMFTRHSSSRQITSQNVYLTRSAICIRYIIPSALLRWYSTDTR